MIIKETILRDVVRLFVWFPFRWFIARTPAKWEIPMFRLMGKLHFVFSRGKKALLVDNLKKAFGDTKSEKEYATIARKYLEEHYVERMVLFLFSKLKKNNIDKYHSIKGWEKVEKCLSRGKGCVLVHAHFGAVHLPLFHIGLKGYDIKQVGLLTVPEGAGAIGRMVTRMREENEGLIPAEIVSANSSLRTLFHCLKKNGLVMIPGDVHSKGHGVERFPLFEFVGHRIHFPTGAAALALKSGAALIPIFTVRDGFSQYKTVIEDEILLPAENSSNKNDIYNHSVRSFINLFTEYIKKYPCHWAFWDEFKPGWLIKENRDEQERLIKTTVGNKL